jgi:hypothetical protein
MIAGKLAGKLCRLCGTRVPNRRAYFCSGRCRQKAYRRRKQGLPEQFAIAGLPQGSRSLAESWDAIQRLNITESVPPPFS